MNSYIFKVKDEQGNWIDIPAIKGSQGEAGADGQDGFSPIANVTQSGDVTTITITDKDGTTTEDIDISAKQNITDNTLTTTSKTIVGAINELDARPSMPSLDEETITTNSDDELQAVAVIDNNSGNTLKQWTGTKAQYDAITTKDSNTLYNITDDSDITLTLLETIYPVGASFSTFNNTCPLSALFGTWQLQATAVVTSVTPTATVRGNGITLGLTNGSTNAGAYYDNNYPRIGLNNASYNTNIGSASASGSSITNLTTVGITTDPTKSGIEATVTSTSMNLNIFKRIS